MITMILLKNNVTIIFINIEKESILNLFKTYFHTL